MKRILQVTFIFMTLVGFALPVLRFNRSGTVSEKENRVLAPRPPLLRDGYLNDTLFSQYSAYFDDRFGGRQRLISLNSAVNNMLGANTVVANDKAIKGKDGWYFYISSIDGDNLSDFYKRNLFTEEQYADFKRRVASTAAWCAEQGIPCIFLVCPNKHSVYSEHYLFERPAGITRADQITVAFEECGVPYLFPRDFLLSKKADYDVPLYHECGTHWNQLGAYLAATLLKSKIEECLPNILFPHINYSITDSYPSTDDSMLGMLGLKADVDKSTRVVVEPNGHIYADFYEYLKNDGRNGVHTKGADKRLPRALIFRDSFFTALEPFVSPLFSEAEYIWKQFREEDKELVLQYKPNIIIFEAVERYAPSICDGAF